MTTVVVSICKTAKMNKFQHKDVQTEVKVDIRNQSQNISRHVSRAAHTATMYWRLLCKVGVVKINILELNVWRTTKTTTLYKWCTVASGTFKYVAPRLTCHHEGAARVMTFQPRDNIFECSTSKRASSVLSYDQLRASTKSRWIIYLHLCFTPKKHRNSLCVTV